MKHLRIIAATSIMMLSVGMSGQPQGARPAPPKQKTPEEIAKMEADRMNSELGLTEKQYKKVYKLVKKDQQYRQDQAEEQFGGGMQFPGGGPGGMGGPGMGGGMMGGGMMGSGPGMGGPGGESMGGSRPTPDEMGQMEGPDGERPEMRKEDSLVTEQYLEKQEQKLKKILTAEQYTQWRSKHPAERLELPPIEFNID